MDGFLIIDKPKGISSFGVIKEVRKILNTSKIGHLGTLDPLATGVLVLATGQATKLVEFLMGADKLYEAEIFLGARSNTYDAEGEITSYDFELFPDFESKLDEVIAEFLGEQMQMPPSFSALKINGRKAYDLARKGEEVVLKPRKIHISKIEKIAFSWPFLKLLVECGSGTYIRSIAHDLGLKLGCGGYLNNLRRLRVGSFKIEDAITISAEMKNSLIKMDKVIESWPRFDLSNFVYQRLKNGLSIDTPKKLQIEDNEKENFSLLAAFCDDKFVGVLQRCGGGKFLKFKKQIQQ